MTRTSSQTGLLTPPPDRDIQCLPKPSISLHPPSMVLRFRPARRRRSNGIAPDSETDTSTPLLHPTVTGGELINSVTPSPSDNIPSLHPHLRPYSEIPAQLPISTPSEKNPESQPPITSSLDPSSTAFELWKQARSSPQALDSEQSAPTAGSHRPVTLRNVALAFHIIQASAVQLFLLLWTIHPIRILLFLALNFVRGLLPAVRSYSQSLLLDQVHLAVSTRVITSRLVWLFLFEIFRMLFEAIFEHFATGNERAVQQNIRFRVEYVQMETRLRLDIPSLSDPLVQDLLTESDLFARSFNGVGGALGLMSPFDLVRTFTMLFTEIAGQSYVLYTLLGEGQGRLTAPQVLLIGSALVPNFIGVVNWLWTKMALNAEDDSEATQWPHALYNPEEAETAEKHERMRRLAYDESFKSEIMLFGLAKWILKTWVETREALLTADSRRDRHGASSPKIFGLVHTGVAMEFIRESTRELMLTLQAIPLILQLSTTTLGNATLYRTSIQTVISSVQTLSRTFQLTYQSIFLMGAFHAALTLQPSMEPSPSIRVPYETAVSTDGKRSGMKIEAQNLWFTYPGESEPVIRGLNLKVEPGEVIAIVGKNGCGKSTLMHLLLRLFDHDRTASGSSSAPSRLLINDQPAEVYSPEELHAHSSAVFQNFSKLTNASIRENAGVGDVDHMEDEEVVTQALEDGGALGFAQNLKEGIDTRLEAGGFGGGVGVGGRGRGWAARRGAASSVELGRPPRQHKVALSGGQWQRVALSRSFMRSTSDLLVLDEASSQLDAHAQNEVFSQLLSPKTRGKRTIIFITHRLSTVRWADKIAFFDEGQVKEFGTHDELMAVEEGGYKSLYGAFVSSAGGSSALNTSESEDA